MEADEVAAIVSSERLRCVGGSVTGCCTSIGTSTEEVVASVFAFFVGGSEAGSKERAELVSSAAEAARVDRSSFDVGATSSDTLVSGLSARGLVEGVGVGSIWTCSIVSLLGHASVSYKHMTLPTKSIV